jgi:hypothetical protein
MDGVFRGALCFDPNRVELEIARDQVKILEAVTCGVRATEPRQEKSEKPSACAQLEDMEMGQLGRVE